MIKPPSRARLLTRPNVLITVIVTLAFLSGHSPPASLASDFPRYEVIADNVAFWEKIYETYSLNQAVIHDSKDLSRVYEIIKLRPNNGSKSRAYNQKAQERAIRKYRIILAKLSKQQPRSPEENRIASLFKGKNRQKSMARAANNVRSQTGQKERFRDGVIQSGAYMKEIKRIFRSYRLPEELSYLPHVESSFNTKAYSKFGAAGIWQFTRSTGKRYLKIDYILDERLDPFLASHAAAKYLKNSYRRLGSWSLAITSYNYGLSGMLRARKKYGSYPDIFKKYNEGHFKFASKNFYAEFLAALKAAKRLEKKLQLAPPQTTRKYKLPGFIHVDDIKKHFNISKATVQNLNPALRSAVINGEKLIPKAYSLRLPQGEQMSTLLASVPTSIIKKKQKPSHYHRVKRGETASGIARLHRVPLKSLLRANNLDKYATIYIRQKLRIPSLNPSVVTLSKIPRITARPKIKKENESHRESIPILSSAKKHRPTEKGYDFLPSKDPTVYNVFSHQIRNGKPSGMITVQPGESLKLYAEWLGIKRTNLIALNSLDATVQISPGQQILVPLDTVNPDAFEEKRLDFLLETEEDFFSAYRVVGQKTYTVISGDTLWDLCYNKFDIPLWLLERYNSSINLAKLQNKQELIIPLVQQL